jgi:peptidoglycan/LPS O-acetylase OafA/YrhL
MADSANPSTLPRQWPGLDVLRGIAITLVLILHFPTRFPELLDELFGQIKLIAWAGVDLFFVLSGFLIAHLLLQEYTRHGRVNIGRFWIRRAFKIYPSLYFLIALSLSGAAIPNAAPTLWRTLTEFAFLQSYFPHLWQHTWSLAVEEHFYILIALFFILPNTATLIKHWPLVVLTIITICFINRLLVSSVFTYETHLYPTHLRIDSLFVGTLVAYLYYFHREKTRAQLQAHRIKLLIIAFALVRLGFWGRLEDSRFVQTFGLILLACGCAIFVALTVFGIFSYTPKLIAQPIITLGRISYGTYLWHLPVVNAMEHYFPSTIGALTGFATYLAASITLGYISTRFVEDPLLRLRDRFFPRPPRPSPAAPIPTLKSS